MRVMVLIFQKRTARKLLEVHLARQLPTRARTQEAAPAAHALDAPRGTIGGGPCFLESSKATRDVPTSGTRAVVALRNVAAQHFYHGAAVERKPTGRRVGVGVGAAVALRSS